jgi:hypothetical protein
MAVYEESGGDASYGGRPSRPYEGSAGPRRPSEYHVYTILLLLCESDSGI